MGKLIGLTGGIGSGKSTVANLLAERGAVVIDADEIAHGVYDPGTEGHEKVVARFGTDILDANGSVDRAKLGARVFGDRQALTDLNAIVHPLVRKTVISRISEALAEDPGAVVVVEAALMTETGWSGGAGELWVVVTDPRIAAERLIRLRGMDPDDVRLRMAAQASNAERRRHATYVIENNGSLLDLEAEVAAVWRRSIGE
jgi:dephospho-CoA kinase